MDPLRCCWSQSNCRCIRWSRKKRPQVNTSSTSSLLYELHLVPKAPQYYLAVLVDFDLAGLLRADNCTIVEQ